MAPLTATGVPVARLRSERGERPRRPAAHARPRSCPRGRRTALDCTVLSR
ncbi:hypothetical protein HD597_004141 [Nonomuraea thailandensis]|uniref:Uncharacterized protein n=1 Tax=Nonomuraea thailandensis TaxID=1188745 RepID=A0A9X2GKE9_9ACTN|nr:hypothetical protein [Nonomuraea thailandensis]